MRTIQYAISQDGHVYSRVGSEVAIPVLDYERIGEGGDFSKPFQYHLEKFSVYTLAGQWADLRWTRKIPVALKNLHRQFWGLPPLRPEEGD
jgi:hypothetical protein